MKSIFLIQFLTFWVIWNSQCLVFITDLINVITAIKEKKKKHMLLSQPVESSRSWFPIRPPSPWRLRRCKAEVEMMNRRWWRGREEGWGKGEEGVGQGRRFVADFLPEGKSRERNPKVQRGTVEPAPVPGRPSPLWSIIQQQAQLASVKLFLHAPIR